MRGARRLVATLSTLATLAALAGLSGCGSSGAGTGSAGEGDDGRGGSRTVRLYTSVTQNTVDAVVHGFEAQHPGTHVSVFRAPTGTLNARIATDQRTGGVRADVIWGTDPLSVHGLDAQGLLRAWTPDGVGNVPEQFRTNTFWGTRVLRMVAIVHKGTEPPATWADLADPRFKDAVALPDPGFAGSALAVLGYFNDAPGYGLGFYRKLHDNGAAQLSAIDDVVTQVAEGRYRAGVTLSYSARAAIDGGSPIAIAYPRPGAIELYSPIGVFKGSDNRKDAEAFVEHTLSPQGQREIAQSGWQPVLAAVPDKPEPDDVPVVSPDWPALFGHAGQVLDGYRAIFGG